MKGQLKTTKQISGACNEAYTITVMQFSNTRSHLGFGEKKNQLSLELTLRAQGRPESLAVNLTATQQQDVCQRFCNTLIKKTL